MFKSFFLWAIVLLAVVLNFFDLVAPLQIFDNLRYGHMLAKKFFLILIAFGFLGYWIYTNKNLLQVLRQNLIPLIIIAGSLGIARILSFTRWFYFDDFRILSHHVAATDLHSVACCGSGNFPLALFHFLISFFGMNFMAYNLFGLFLYFLVGVVIFTIIKNFNKKNFTALLISVFFVTSPTYFHETLAMNEFIGNASALLLFVIAVYFVIVRFWQGVIIFTVAALELGLSRTHTLPIFLTTMVWMFTEGSRKGKAYIKSYMLLVPAILFTLALPYRNIIFGIDIFSKGLKAPSFDRLFIYPDMVFGTMVPHGISYVLISLLYTPFKGYWYISTIIGILIVTSLTLLLLWLFKQKKILAAKLILVGLVIVLGSLALPSMTGSRVEGNLKALTAQYTSTYPVRATSYGVFPTFGMALILSGFALLVSYKKFKLFIIPLLILNTFTLINSDRIWATTQSRDLKTLTIRLGEIFPEDGKTKIIHIPPHTRHLWDSLNTFQGLYRPKEKFLITGGDRNEFINLINEHKLPAGQLYFLKLHYESLTIIDFSEQIRPYYPNDMTGFMDKLTW